MFFSPFIFLYCYQQYNSQVNVRNEQSLVSLIKMKFWEFSFLIVAIYFGKLLIHCGFRYFLKLQGVELGEPLVNMIKNRLLIILMVLDIMHYTMLFGGIITFIVFTSWYFIRKSQENKVKPMT